MPNIFVSWSKAKSREFALEIKYLIESLDPHSNVFMSEENISAGCKLRSNGMPVPLLRNGYSIFNGTKYR